MAEPEKKVIYQEEAFYQFSPEGTPHLIGSKCRICGHVAFPPKVVCPACVTNGSMDEMQLSSKGKIDTFSVLHVGAPGFKVPYILSWVILDEGPRVLSLITGCEPSEDSIEIGTKVELVIEKIREDEQGNEVRGYKFRPINAERKTG